MKISNSKKKLAEIINDRCGWRESARWAVQNCNGNVVFTECNRPKWSTFGAGWEAEGDFLIGCHHEKLKHWNQTILSRDEYFHLYPAPGADHSEESLDMVEVNQERGPTIEQLAAEYRNHKDYAERKRQEAYADEAEAERKLSEIVAAGKAAGLAVSVSEPEPELVITDLRYLLVGDVVECVSPNIRKDYYAGMVGVIVEMDNSHTPILVLFDNGQRIWCHEVKFIRRP